MPKQLLGVLKIPESFYEMSEEDQRVWCRTLVETMKSSLEAERDDDAGR